MQIKITPRFCLFLICTIMIVFSVSIGISRIGLARGAQQLETVYAEQAALERQILALREELDYVRTDDYVERIARDELKLMRPGEIRYTSNNY